MRVGRMLGCLGIVFALLAGGCAAQHTSVMGSDSQETKKETEDETMTAGEESSEPVLEDGTEKEPETEDGTEPAVVCEPQVYEVTVTATGDCTFGITQKQSYDGSFYEYYDLYGEDYFFQDVSPIFEQDDFTLINLECVLTTSDDLVEKKWNLKGKPEYVGIMTGSSIEGCSLGNNHTFDYGQSSHDETELLLEQSEIVYGFNEHVGIYTTKEGVTIGVVSANLLSQTAQYENYVRDGLKYLEETGTDIKIVCCHWGIELEQYPTEYQQNMAHRIVDWGADLVIGNHPHVLQGMELYKGKVICYSLGNFCFGGNKNPKNKDTMIYQQTFTVTDGCVQEDLKARVIPCTVSSVSDRNDFQPTIAQGARRQAIISELNTFSEPYSGLVVDEEGNLDKHDE